MPLLGYIIAFCFLFAVVSKEQNDRKGVLLSGLAMVAGMLGIHQLFVLAVVFTKTKQAGLTAWETVTHATFWPIGLAYVLGGIALTILQTVLARQNRRSLLHVAFGLVAVLLLNFAVGIGGYLWNYMLYALPAIFTCVLAFLRSERRWWPVVIVLVIASLTYHQEKVNKVARKQGSVAISQDASEKLDAILDACGYSRYAYAGAFPWFAFSRHSPIGPMFTPYFHEYLGYDHPLYEQTFAAIRREGRVLVEEAELSDERQVDVLPHDVRALFSDAVPACADNLPVPNGFVLRYRTNAN
jgi:hypothetical protein